MTAPARFRVAAASLAGWNLALLILLAGGGGSLPLGVWGLLLVAPPLVGLAFVARSTGTSPRSEPEGELAALRVRLGEEQARAEEDRERLRAEVQRRSEAQEALAVARDQALAVARAKSAFLANMSHELRTPLNAITGYSQLLQEEADAAGDVATVRDLQKIEVASRHLLELISDILDLTKIESGHVNVHLEEVDLAAFCKQVLGTIQPLADVNANALTSRFEDGLGRMTVDARKLRQALFNLLSNACKFTDGGTVHLEVARFRQSGQPWIRFAVSDTGIGLSPEKVDHIFEEFVQADDSVSRRYGGTGLGLPISRRLCQVMGGEIEVSSVLGEGSTFEILLPTEEIPGLVPAPPREQVPGAHPAYAAPISASPEPQRALVIDDDHDMRQRIEEVLRREGFAVAVASDGSTGIELARSSRPDVIVLDVVMPEMDGWKILTVLKRDPTLADIPVFMLAVADRKGMAVGVVDYLVKPVDRSRLLGALAGIGLQPDHGTVLVVEDDDALREVTRRMLRSRGWKVEEAVDGVGALRSVAARRPSAIVLDLMMPVVDGFQVIAALQENPDWASIPILVQSAMEIPPRLRRGLQGRVTSAIEDRGTTRQELVAQIRGLLDVRARPRGQPG